MKYPTTPDGRYFVVRGRLWRCTNPQLDESVRQQWTRRLMAARRQVKEAKKENDDALLAAAREAVHIAKVALGERGPTWWDDDTDFNRHLVGNTPYASWWDDFPSEDVTPESDV